MVLQRATQNGQIAFPATGLPVNVTVTAFPLRDGRFPGGGSSTTRAVPENSKTATRVNPGARNLLVFFLGEKSPNGDNMEHFWRKFSFTSRKRSPKFSLCFFFWGRGGGGCCCRSVCWWTVLYSFWTKMSPIKLKSVWGCSPLLLNYKIGENNITGPPPPGHSCWAPPTN